MSRMNFKNFVRPTLKIKRIFRGSALSLSIVASTLFSLSSFAQLSPLAPSPFRYHGESGRAAAQRALRTRDGKFNRKPLDPGDVYSSRMDIHAVTPELFSTWNPELDPQTVFEEIRNKRYIEDPSHPHFLRRITWLYPDDGCFVRAELMSERLQAMGLPAPTKLFAFGSLNVKTPYSPSGEVNWWYHVVVAYQVHDSGGDSVIVFDPAVESSAPLKMSAWLEDIGAVGEASVSVCDAGAFSPSSFCKNSTPKAEIIVKSAELSFLNAEWERMFELELEPENILGDFPPWLNL